MEAAENWLFGNLFYFYVMNMKKKCSCDVWAGAEACVRLLKVSKLSVSELAAKKKKHLSYGCTNSHTMEYDPLRGGVG